MGEMMAWFGQVRGRERAQAPGPDQTSPAPAAKLPSKGAHMSQPDDSNLIWIDLEMTGLDPDNDSILVIVTVVTNRDLDILAEGPVMAIAHDEARLLEMDEWNRNQHGRSGLWKQVLESDVDHAAAETRTLAFLADWVSAGRSPMCGNTICQDRRFLYRQMPRLERDRKSVV